MVIGTPAALRGLAEQIISGVSASTETESAAWPRQVASVAIPSDPTAEDPYTISFHVETTPGTPPTNVARDTKPFYLFILLGAFALVGAVATVRWVIANVF